MSNITEPLVLEQGKRFLEISLGKYGSIRIGLTLLEKPYWGTFIYKGPFGLNIAVLCFFWLYVSVIFIRETKLGRAFGNVLEKIKKEMQDDSG